MVSGHYQDKLFKKDEAKRLDQVYAYVAKSNEETGNEKQLNEQRQRFEKMSNLKEQLQN